MTSAARHLDGLNAVRDPGAAAELAAEVLRVVNRLTIGAPSPGAEGWEDIGDLYRVLGEICVLADRLPQVMNQLARHLQRNEAQCRSDAGTQPIPQQLVVVAVEAFGRAHCATGRVGRDLVAAQSAVAHLAPPG